MKFTRLFAIFLMVMLICGCVSDHYSSAYTKYQKFPADQLFARGVRALNSKDYEKSLKYLQALDVIYPFGAYAQRGHLTIIKAYYKKGAYEEALVAADRYIQLYPTDAYLDYAYYMRGMANFRMNRGWINKIYSKDPAGRDLKPLNDAFKDFSMVVRLFPSSKYAVEARKRMLYIRNVMAAYELEVAKFYYERKAYVAAANRAAYVVEHIENSPQVAAALKIMVKSYRALGAKRKAYEAYQVLKRNYPVLAKRL